MSTHGRIRVQNGSSKKGAIILYAWSDGHTSDIVSDLIKLPHTIFNLARERNRVLAMEKRDVGGPWFHQVFLMCSRKDGNEADFRQSWLNLSPLEFHYAGVANWISYIHFSRWVVVPNKAYCAYPGNKPDVVVECGSRADGYAFNVIDWKEDDFEEKVDTLIKEANHNLPTSIHIARGGNRITVPFMDIVGELMWQDVQLARKIARGRGKNKKDAWMKKVFAV